MKVFRIWQARIYQKQKHFSWCAKPIKYITHHLLIYFVYTRLAIKTMQCNFKWFKISNEYGIRIRIRYLSYGLIHNIH